MTTCCAHYGQPLLACHGCLDEERNNVSVDLRQKLETKHGEIKALQDEIDLLTKRSQKVDAEVERLKAAESILVDQHEADHKEVVGLHEEVERLKSRLTCEQCDSTKSIDGGSICFACWNRVCAEKQSALLQKERLSAILNDISGMAWHTVNTGNPLDPGTVINRIERSAENRVDVPECGNCGGDLVRKTEPTWICPKCEL